MNNTTQFPISNGSCGKSKKDPNQDRPDILFTSYSNPASWCLNGAFLPASFAILTTIDTGEVKWRNPYHFSAIFCPQLELVAKPIHLILFGHISRQTPKEVQRPCPSSRGIVCKKHWSFCRFHSGFLHFPCLFFQKSSLATDFIQSNGARVFIILQRGQRSVKVAQTAKEWWRTAWFEREAKMFVRADAKSVRARKNELFRNL